MALSLEELDREDPKGSISVDPKVMQKMKK
jgi:hypothetical protein